MSKGAEEEVNPEGNQRQSKSCKYLVKEDQVVIHESEEAQIDVVEQRRKGKDKVEESNFRIEEVSPTEVPKMFEATGRKCVPMENFARMADLEKEIKT